MAPITPQLPSFHAMSRGVCTGGHCRRGTSGRNTVRLTWWQWVGCGRLVALWPRQQRWRLPLGALLLRGLASAADGSWYSPQDLRRCRRQPGGRQKQPSCPHERPAAAGQDGPHVWEGPWSREGASGETAPRRKCCCAEKPGKARACPPAALKVFTLHAAPWRAASPPAESRASRGWQGALASTPCRAAMGPVWPRGAPPSSRRTCWKRRWYVWTSPPGLWCDGAGIAPLQRQARPLEHPPKKPATTGRRS